LLTPVSCRLVGGMIEVGLQRLHDLLVRRGDRHVAVVAVRRVRHPVGTVTKPQLELLEQADHDLASGNGTILTPATKGSWLHASKRTWKCSAKISATFVPTSWVSHWACLSRRLPRNDSQDRRLPVSHSVVYVDWGRTALATSAAMPASIMSR